jgi:threonine dehydrogenase-like Zn-dependent dehydrogenase
MNPRKSVAIRGWDWGRGCVSWAGGLRRDQLGKCLHLMHDAQINKMLILLANKGAVAVIGVAQQSSKVLNTLTLWSRSKEIPGLYRAKCKNNLPRAGHRGRRT